MSGLSENVNELEFKLRNISSSSIQNPNLVLYAKQHDLASDVAPTWEKLDLTTSFGDEVLTKTISDGDQNKWMVFSSSQLRSKINEARDAGMKLALILKYPNGATDGAAIKFENINAYRGSSGEFDTSAADEQTPDNAQPLINDGANDFTLVFSDEFNDTKINPEKWSGQTRRINKNYFQLYANEDQAAEKEGDLQIYYSKDIYIPSRSF